MIQLASMTFASGFIFGGLMALIRLPVPAPATVAGLLGVVGLTLGYMTIQAL